MTLFLAGLLLIFITESIKVVGASLNISAVLICWLTTPESLLRLHLTRVMPQYQALVLVFAPAPIHFNISLYDLESAAETRH